MASRTLCGRECVSSVAVLAQGWYEDWRSSFVRLGVDEERLGGMLRGRGNNELWMGRRRGWKQGNGESERERDRREVRVLMFKVRTGA